MTSRKADDGSRRPVTWLIVAVAITAVTTVRLVSRRSRPDTAGLATSPDTKITYP